MLLPKNKLKEDISFIRKNKLEYTLKEKGYDFHYYSHKPLYEFTIEYRTDSHIIRIQHVERRNNRDNEQITTSVRFDIVFRDTIEVKTISKEIFKFLYVKNNEKWTTIIEKLISDIEQIKEEHEKSAALSA
ncbi:hypothetical protein [Bacillus thuringiensis]|uniref:hypothetical protein n=1 Tax=Bacillus thuringiensis TaxID=1428 RepID=UPI0021D69663|nr:hypothetical protein [Bacillus thuringiensis]MCU7667392.1 hypothetical protein [Bacillus thuringiensis]